MRTTTGMPTSGTPADLIRAAELGGRLEVRIGRARGLGDEAIRRQVEGRLRAEFGDDGDLGGRLDELVAAAHRGVDAALAEGRRRGEPLGVAGPDPAGSPLPATRRPARQPIAG